MYLDYTYLALCDSAPLRDKKAVVHLPENSCKLHNQGGQGVGGNMNLDHAEAQRVGVEKI